MVLTWGSGFKSWSGCLTSPIGSADQAVPVTWGRGLGSNPARTTLRRRERRGSGFDSPRTPLKKKGSGDRGQGSKIESGAGSRKQRCLLLTLFMASDPCPLTPSGVCSWESVRSPKPPDRVRILALLLADVARTRKAPVS
jgi:hypothetical protein